jgi:hypothetical protein
MPHELTLHFRTDAHAPVTVDAPCHVDRDVWVRTILSSGIRHTLGGAIYQPGATNLLMKRLVGKRAQRIGRIASDEHLENPAPCLFELRRVCLDFHAIRDGRAACGDEL